MYTGDYLTLFRSSSQLYISTEIIINCNAMIIEMQNIAEH